MADLNNCSFTGNLARDPETKSTKDGSFTVFTIAVNGYKKDDTMFLDCVVFGKQADSCKQYLFKGLKVAIAGRLNLKKWEKDGVKKESPQIIVNSVTFLSAKSDNSQAVDTSFEPF